jgi:hypothetical protein
MNILAGGFLGRGVRMKAGETTFKPLEWKTVDSTGDDLNKNIVPLPMREISGVILELLKFLVGYGERIAGSGDIQVGEIPGQNVKAGTMEIANENGRLIFSAIFKRIWRSLKQEFKKLYRLNQLYQDDDDFVLGERYFEIKKNDYDYPDSGIVPAADPHIVSKTEQRQRADVLAQRANAVPGYDRVAVERRWLEAYDVPGAEAIYDPEKFKPQGPDPAMIELQVKVQREETRRLDVTQKNQIAVAALTNDIQESQAKILEMTANAMKLAKEAEGVEKEQAIKLLYATIESESSHRDDLIRVATMLMDAIKDGHGPGTIQPVAKAAGDAGVLPLPLAVPPVRDGGVGAAQAA